MGWAEQCKAEASALSKERRQAVLDRIRKGQTIGEAQEAEGLTLAAVCGIISMNINTVETLNTKTL